MNTAKRQTRITLPNTGKTNHYNTGVCGGHGYIWQK